MKKTLTIGSVALTLVLSTFVATFAGRIRQDRFATDGAPDPIVVEQWGMRIAPALLATHPNANAQTTAIITRNMAIAFANEFDRADMTPQDAKWRNNWTCRDHLQCLHLTCPPLYDPACDPTETGSDENGCYCQGY
jgi:hypothetical protein